LKGWCVAIANHDREETRKRRPLTSVSITKSSDQTKSIEFDKLLLSHHAFCFVRLIFDAISDASTRLNGHLPNDGNLIETGQLHIQKEEWNALRVVVIRLWDLIPEQARTAAELRQFTGIV